VLLAASATVKVDLSRWKRSRVHPKLAIHKPLSSRSKTKSEGCRYANDADSLLSTRVNFVTSSQARGRPVVNTSWSTGRRGCLLEVRRAATSVATLAVEQMRDSIAASDLKATRSARGDDELAPFTADERINI